MIIKVQNNNALNTNTNNSLDQSYKIGAAMSARRKGSNLCVMN